MGHSESSSPRATPVEWRTHGQREPTIPSNSVDLALGELAAVRDGQIAYELEEFRKDYGNPEGRLFTFELTYNGTTYVYANVAGDVRSGQVVFDFSGDDLVGTRKSH